jgi:hypothetical protein
LVRAISFTFNGLDVIQILPTTPVKEKLYVNEFNYYHTHTHTHTHTEKEKEKERREKREERREKERKK